MAIEFEGVDRKFERFKHCYVRVAGRNDERSIFVSGCILCVKTLGIPIGVSDMVAVGVVDAVPLAMVEVMPGRGLLLINFLGSVHD